MHKSALTERIELASILGQVLSDDELATRARSILRWKIRYNSVRVVAQNGHVILSGNVLSYVDRDAAEHIVRKLTGVITLTNRIITTLPYITRLHHTSATVDQSMDSPVV